MIFATLRADGSCFSKGLIGPSWDRLCCKSLLVSPIAKFPGRGGGDRILMWGTTSFCDELTGDIGGAFEATSIDGCRLFCHLAEILPHGVLGVLQQNRPNSDIVGSK